MNAPTLNAMMCDGMGSFSDTDYKRMLLAFDQIYYLLPEELVEFRDISGRPSHLLFPPHIRAQTTAFASCSYPLDDRHREVILRASKADYTADALRQAVDMIPAHELLYTWRVVNADAGFAAGRSMSLSPEQTGFAQLLLLNKFLLAAEAHQSVPITGKAYVHRLLTLKYKHAEQAIAAHAPEVLSTQLRQTDLSHAPFVARLISEFVSDAELERRSLSDIVDYKHRNAALFEEFSLSVRALVSEIESLPTDAAFQRDVNDVLSTKVWKARRDLEKEMRTAWDSFFKSGLEEAIKSDAAKTVAKAVGSALAVGVLPHLSPGTLTWASALAAGGAVAPWLITELMEAVSKRREARRNGLYYLVGFKE